MKLTSLIGSGLFLVFFCLAPAVFGQGTDRAFAIGLHNTGQYAKAVDALKKVVKADEKDAEALYWLGGSYLKLEKYKDSIKALKKATQLDPRNDTFLALLAYVYMTIADNDATAAANEALKLNQDNAEAHFVLGMVAYRTESFTMAYDRAKRVIQLKPTFTGAYRLKAQALIGSYMALDGKILPPAVRADLLPEAVADLEKFVSLISNTEMRKEVEEEVATMRAVVEYYSLPENRILKDTSAPEAPDPTRTPLKVLAKPRPGYTDSARSRNVQGTARLLVSFDAIGRVGRILVVKSLDPSLDRQAIVAANKIKFQPEKRNGVPVTVYKMVEYSFSIY